MIPTHHHPQFLALFAHPALERSRVNRRLGAEIRDLPSITGHRVTSVFAE